MKKVFKLSIFMLCSLTLLIGCGTFTNTTMPGSNTNTTTSAATAISANNTLTENLKDLHGKTFERTFLQYMLMHHRSSIDMAKLAVTHAQSPDLKKLAQTMITEQNQEIEEMTAWLKQWYNVQTTVDSVSMPWTINMVAAMNSLKNTSGPNFDQLFLSDMQAHHQQAIDMSNLLPTRTQRQELLQLGKNIISEKSTQIQQMANLEKQAKLS